MNRRVQNNGKKKNIKRKTSERGCLHGLQKDLRWTIMGEKVPELATGFLLTYNTGSFPNGWKNA